ncbi:MAG TPA: hypothetical protein PLU30_18985 [Verrucomicrobiae bacterium]|nr:hypothetical protein [Verrucomicrobiae bacterium]
MPVAPLGCVALERACRLDARTTFRYAAAMVGLAGALEFARGLFLVAGLAVAAFAANANAGGDYFSVTYPPSSETNVLQVGVTYTLWIPGGTGEMRGLIVHQHGCGVGACKGGATAAYDLHWQALAKKWRCGLLGPSYHQEEKQNCRLWCDPRNGSDKAFLRSLRDLAVQSKHPELERVPWCLWGHSGGGFWASLMQVMHPQQIVAIWFRSGTAYSAWERGEVPRPEIPAAALGIPMMCNPGTKERDHERFKGAWEGLTAMFRAYRAEGAPIGFAPDPNTSHECGDSRYLAIPFFDACLAMRLPDKAGEQLKAVDFRRSWLAGMPGDEPGPADQFSGDAKTSVWLPDARVAKAWMEYVIAGEVADTTPPPAPSGVSATPKPDGAVELTWGAEADLESGIQAFVIQRDGKEVGRVPEKGLTKFGKPLFQTMSYHDTPEAPLPEMRFVDKAVSGGGSHEYRVLTLNGVGLTSGPSDAVRN